MYLYKDPEDQTRAIDLEKVAVICKCNSGIGFDSVTWVVKEKDRMFDEISQCISYYIRYSNLILVLDQIQTVELTPNGIIINGIFYLGEFDELFREIHNRFKQFELSHLATCKVLIALDHIKYIDVTGKIIEVNDSVKIELPKKKMARQIYNDLTKMLLEEAK